MRRSFVLAAAAALMAVAGPTATPAAAQARGGGDRGDQIGAPASASDPLEAAAWLAGCWEAASRDGANATEEVWMAPRGGLMVGMSRSVRGGEARGYESATIRADEAGRLVYHAVPSGQAATDFPARSVSDGRLEFVNAEHDFPRKIVYARIDSDLVHAAVFGEADGAEPAFLLPFRRVRCPGR